MINIKNDNNERFRWCHIRKNPQRIKKTNKPLISQFSYSSISFTVTTRQYNKIEKQCNINLNVFGYEDEQLFPIHISNDRFEITWNYY